jgi:spore germination cell wall hydrolase CwlJ-like protein
MLQSAETEDSELLAYIDTNIHCMAQTIYYEARGEGALGMLAVAHVVLNRMQSPKFPASDACGIVKQPGQFSWYKKPSKVVDHAAFASAFSIAWDVLSGETKDPTKGATMFHASHVSPGWNSRIKAKINNQVFY